MILAAVNAPCKRIPGVTRPSPQKYVPTRASHLTTAPRPAKLPCSFSNTPQASTKEREHPMKTFGRLGSWTLLPLLATVGWHSCNHAVKSSTAPLPVNVKVECTPDPDWVDVHVGESIIWHAQDGHHYSVHFKDGRTPLHPPGNPAINDHPFEKATPPVTADDPCLKSGFTDCKFRYYLLEEDAIPPKKCPDPGVHVTP